jgi:hypothetical protein
MGLIEINIQQFNVKKVAAMLLRTECPSCCNPGTSPELHAFMYSGMPSSGVLK